MRAPYHDAIERNELISAIKCCKDFLAELAVGSISDATLESWEEICALPTTDGGKLLNPILPTTLTWTYRKSRGGRPCPLLQRRM